MKNLKITVNGTVYDVQVEEVGNTPPASISTTPAVVPQPAVAPTPAPAPVKAPAAKADVPADAELISCPMPGTIVSVNVTPGQSVKKNDVLLILEAMKMENEIMAPHDATVAAVHVNKGDSVDSGAPLVSLH
ncbi:biotin/lipoyl-binding protein [Caproiciproducens galactitolivorans]|uniref:Glutaconyl-CoA decarboxylase subunit gamma n=1 Tax=Caproiciproducens galactitolivorans TaxID=642589 RepID=A0A4Z0YCM6_9FIRM|nr:biotin/lipoyl-containing protein [Caproiciproducens galactitolivorans]QEY34026.1 biotin/lipoyl-binding protein [Caproiciproducens galactitolivorans]TGJ76563.1 glutaconyl-CoA decarboxylase subunit gamma [Caproiciproducens galactitolivorans]